MYTKYTSDLKESEGDLEENQLVTPVVQEQGDSLDSSNSNYLKKEKYSTI